MSSIIQQVDESTKGLMENIQSGISSSIEDGIGDVKSKVDSVDRNTEELLRKFKNFDGLNTTIDELHRLAEQSKSFAEIASPIQSGVSAIQQDALSKDKVLSKQSNDIKEINEKLKVLEDKQNSIISEIKNIIASSKDELAKKDEDNMRAILNSIQNLEKTHKDFINLYNEKEDAHVEFEKSTNEKLQQINNSIEKVQTSIDIVVNLVTPFWKKWK